MFKKIRWKFVGLVSGITFLCLLIICAVLNSANYASTYNRLVEQSDEALVQRASSPSISPSNPPDSKDKEVAPHAFIVEISEDAYVFSSADAFPYTEEELTALADSAFSSSSSHGFIGYLFFSKETSRVSFIDARSERESLERTLWISTGVSFAAFSVISISSYFFSAIVVRPYEKLYESERRFLTDASHELKTPLAIINANLEVLDKEYPNSHWIASSLEQGERMRGLINGMVSLNKIEESSKNVTMEEFDLAMDLNEAVESYASLAMKKRVELKADVPDSLLYRGNEELILKLFGILLDNACKYVNEDGVIEVCLKEEKKRVLLSFSNTVSALNPEKLSHCFDRFYTFNEARNRAEGGYGIGLSIAKAVVNEHRGQIKAEAMKENSEVRFLITLKK